MTNTLPEIRGFFVPSSEGDRLPSILARWFANADSETQEEFIERLCYEFSTWDKPPEFQWAFLSLSSEARQMLTDMALHASEESE